MTEPLKAAIAEFLDGFPFESWAESGEEAAEHILKLVAEHQPQFGPQHIHPLARARARVLKDATNFSNAHHRYTEKGFAKQANEMMACNTACFQVSKHLKELIDGVRARAEREGDLT